MSNQELPVVITAIADARFEGFVAGTLFAQGWSVIFRAIDFEGLENYCTNNPESASTAMLIFSPDLAGISKDCISRVEPRVKQVVGFSDQMSEESSFNGRRVVMSDLPGIIKGRQEWERRVAQAMRGGRPGYSLAEF